MAKPLTDPLYITLKPQTEDTVGDWLENMVEYLAAKVPDSAAGSQTNYQQPAKTSKS